MTAGRINQVCMQPYPNHTKAYCCYHWFAPGAHGLVNCGYTNSGWEAVELQASVGCTTTLPSQAQREDIDIREQATSRRYKEPCTHPSLPRQQAWNSPRKTSSNNAPAHPQQQQHDHVNEPCLKYSNCSLPAMCRPKAPTKTHTSSDWVKGDTECQIFAVHTPVLKTDYQHTWNHLRNIPPKIAFVAVFPRLISMPKDVNLCSFRINRRQLAPFACKSLSTHSCATKNKEKTN